MAKSSDFQILSDIQHILLRPQMYISSTSLESRNLFLDYKFQEINYVPGLFKIVNELIDNALDENVRTQGKFANKIDITIDSKSFSIRDNGRGIPVELVKDLDGKKIYRPVASWAKTKAGSNFSDDANRVTAGMNGVGSALSNIFSTSFIGETADGSNKLVLTCKDNSKIESVKITKSSKKYTEVTMSPDFERFNVEGFDETMIGLIKDRIHNLAICYPKIIFKFNNETVKSESGNAFVKKFDERAVVYSDSKVTIGVMPCEAREFRSHSIVNGLVLYNGGSHVDYISNAICSQLRDYIAKKNKIDVKTLKLPQIKTHLQFVTIIKDFNNMKFDSQTKEKLTNTASEVAKQLAGVDFDKIVKQITKSTEIMEPVVSGIMYRRKEDDDLDAKNKQKNLKRIKVAKHIEANSKKPEEKTLFIAEGDSAISNFIPARNDMTQGAFPLRGKVLNTYGLSYKKILDNKELMELMAILGLRLGHKAVDLTYGHIAIMTDQDVDGGSIQALLINFFYNWPELFEEGRILILNSPLYVLRGKTDNKYFYSKEEFEKYKGSKKGYEIGYIKGLGSLTEKEYGDTLSDPNFDMVKIDDAEYLQMMFSENVEARKVFMMTDHAEAA